MIEQQKQMLKERKKETKSLMRAKEAITDLLGAKKDEPLAFLKSREECVLRCLYEVLAPKAMRTGRNEILIAQNESEWMKRLIKASGKLGVKITEVEVDASGKVTKEALEKAITPRTLSLFISWAEEFSGAIHPVGELGALCKEKEVYVFADAADVIGKVYFRWQDLPVDTLMFSACGISTVVMKKNDQMQKDCWGEGVSKDALYELSSFASHAVDSMDMAMMEYASIKNDVIDRLENSLIDLEFMNKGASFLPDRWTIKFKGVGSEVLSYFLYDCGIFVEEKAGAICVKLDLDEKEKVFDMWDEIIKAVKEIKEFAYE